MKYVWTFSLTAILGGLVWAGEPETVDPQDKIAKLLERIEVLEKRVATLEKSRAGVPHMVTKPDADSLKSETKPGEIAPPHDPVVIVPDINSELDGLKGSGVIQQPKLYRGQGNGDGLRSILGLNETNKSDIPSSWTPRRFNGFTYYVVPLSK